MKTADGAPDTVATAFAYAWWLLGDTAEAERIVRGVLAETAEESAGSCLDGAPSDPAAGTEPLDSELTTAPLAGQEQLQRLIARVRAAAIATPSMCPSSEVALLHDRYGLPLDGAAAIASVETVDAPAALAHGRLEALTELSLASFAHPDRLGGLALANPPDVAHARQCDSCAAAAEALSRGRRELYDLPAAPTTLDLTDDRNSSGSRQAVAEAKLDLRGQPEAIGLLAGDEPAEELGSPSLTAPDFAEPTPPAAPVYPAAPAEADEATASDTHAGTSRGRVLPLVGGSLLAAVVAGLLVGLSLTALVG